MFWYGLLKTTTAVCMFAVGVCMLCFAVRALRDDDLDWVGHLAAVTALPVCAIIIIASLALLFGQ